MLTSDDPAVLDALYNNRALVPDFPRLLQRWQQASALARKGLEHHRDIAYGLTAAETLDLFPAAPGQPGALAPVLVFIHGGYWRSLDKSDFSFIAPVFTEAGAVVVVPNYGLCPAVGIDTIVQQTKRMLVWVARNAEAHGGDPRRILVAGHSAGGHLAALLMGSDWSEEGSDLPPDLAARALSISGVFDLEPLAKVPFLQFDLRLTPDAARRLSPAAQPAPQGRLLALVGGDESPAFLAQNALIGERWGPAVVPVCEAVPGRNHFDVLDPFVDPQAPLHRMALAELGLAGAL